MNKASYLDFLAVPTNPVANFDYIRKAPPYDAWMHDQGHIAKSRSGSMAIAHNHAQKSAQILLAIRNSNLSIEEHQKM